MKLAFWIILVVLYGIGTVTVKWLDTILPDQYVNNKVHYPVLLTMWIISPILVIWFAFKFISSLIFKNRR